MNLTIYTDFRQAEADADEFAGRHLMMTTVCKAPGCDFESTEHYDVACHGYALGAGHYNFERLHRSQVVVARSDGTYTVRTYVLRDDHWDLLREAPADPRSVAQATIDGRVAVAEVQP